MQIALSEVKARRSREREQRITWLDVEQATGIGRNTLIAMDKGTIKQIRPEYIDALAAYFEVSIDDLLRLEAVALPLPEYRSKGHASR